MVGTSNYFSKHTHMFFVCVFDIQFSYSFFSFVVIVKVFHLKIFEIYKTYDMFQTTRFLFSNAKLEIAAVLRSWVAQTARSCRVVNEWLYYALVLKLISFFSHERYVKVTRTFRAVLLFSAYFKCIQAVHLFSHQLAPTGQSQGIQMNRGWSFPQGAHWGDQVQFWRLSWGRHSSSRWPGHFFPFNLFLVLLCSSPILLLSSLLFYTRSREIRLQAMFLQVSRVRRRATQRDYRLLYYKFCRFAARKIWYGRI